MTRTDYLLCPFRLIGSVVIWTVLGAIFLVSFIIVAFPLVLLILGPAEIAAGVLAAASVPVGVASPARGDALLKRAGDIMDWAGDFAMEQPALVGDYVFDAIEYTLDVIWH